MLFGLGAKLFWTSGSQKLAVWPNFRSMCPEQLFQQNNVFKKTLFCFSDFERKKFRQGQKLLAAFFNSILGAQRKFFGCFRSGLMTWVGNSGFLAKVFPRFCQNCFLWDRRIVLKEKILSIKEVCSIVCGPRAKSFQSFGQRFWEGVVKIAFQCTKNRFTDEKHYLEIL